MLNLLLRRSALLALLLAGCASNPSPGTSAAVDAAGNPERARWEQHAQAVTVVRDDWGIAHVRGHTDADAVFGMIYAQAEDDFPRIESNYLDALGRRAEAEGESALWQDLRQKLFIDPDSLQAQWATAPQWLKDVTVAWADGLNYYLATHGDVHPRVIAHFEPWMALSFSEGSIGGDIESISLRELAAFYGKQPLSSSTGASTGPNLKEDKGSNGISIAPANTAAGKALLLINPHTSFFFRSELQMASDEGLNAYGAATWGQLFLYQGFNDRLGWMHTSSGVDVIDEFVETTVEQDGKPFYRYGSELRPVAVKTIAVPYRATDGTMSTRRFTTYRTHHGPVVREQGGKWVSVALMEKPVAALEQSYLRTKARTLAEYQKVMELKANSSNNTLYADADGNIAYFHPQFVPRRDDRIDWTQPVQGSNPDTDWKGEHTLAEMPSIVNPSVGWATNSNNWPYTTSGSASPRPADFPRYMDTFGQNARGQHALRLLTGVRNWTPASLQAAAYDSYMPGFATLVPVLLEAYDALPAGDARRASLAEPIATLRAWDFRWDTSSVATSVAMFWGERLGALGGSGSRMGARTRDPAVTYQEWMAANTTPDQLLQALGDAVTRLKNDFGRWNTPWGEINRFQRTSADIVHRFDDAGPSIPVGFTHGNWGSLASFAAAPRNGTKKWYGTSGNSFVAVVEFGKDSVHARAVTAGGESGHVGNAHFNDEAMRYATGNLREVYYYPSQLTGHTERTYHPGK